MKNDILHIGRVIEVNGSRVVGELDITINDLYRTYNSRKYAIGQVGSIVKILSGDIFIFGVIISLRMVEESESENASPQEKRDSKWIEIELFGEGRKKNLSNGGFSFVRGVSTYPLPGQQIKLATSDELSNIYSKPDKPSINIGNIAQAPNLQAHLILDEFIGKHFAVLGTTGSGKSCTVSLILNAILDEYQFGHIVLLDPHNEYPSAFKGKAELLNQGNLKIPHWLLNFEETIELFVGKTEFAATSQTNILKEAILTSKRKFDPKTPQEMITVDSPIPYKIGNLLDEINSSKALLIASKQDSHTKLINKIESLKNDKRFEFIITPDTEVKDNLADLMSLWLRIPTQKKPLTIIDLSGVPSDVTDVVVSVLCRSIFDFSLWNKDRKDSPLMLVCEEAHRYIPKTDQAAFQPTKRALARIAKEGRKYGVSLGLISQRPSELSENILSQCNTIVSLRMTNDKDQQFVKNALPDSVSSMVNSLPALQTREGVIVGEGVVVPMRVIFKEIDGDNKPSSDNMPFSKAWSEEKIGKNEIARVIHSWRNQTKD